jgi:NAD(P)-dependent dehydrogenase (short-subunit alcohol dehydrogenase family)
MVDLHGKTVVITGASAGIGAAAARQLSALGANLVIVGRSPTKTAAVAEELGCASVVADFAVLDDVRRLADDLLDLCPRIDVLAHNVGGMSLERITTVDGHEHTWQSNYLAPFLLQSLLQGRLTASGARVIFTSSIGHWMGTIRLDDLDLEHHKYSGFGAYCNSKLAGLLFMRELVRRTEGTWMTAFAFHPGLVKTNFLIDLEHGNLSAGQRARHKLLNIVEASEGAAPLVRLATIDDPSGINGQYFSRAKADARTKKTVQDASLASALWRQTAATLAG